MKKKWAMPLVTALIIKRYDYLNNSLFKDLTKSVYIIFFIIIVFIPAARFLQGPNRNPNLTTFQFLVEILIVYIISLLLYKLLLLLLCLAIVQLNDYELILGRLYKRIIIPYRSIVKCKLFHDSYKGKKIKGVIITSEKKEYLITIPKKISIEEFVDFLKTKNCQCS